MPPSLLSVAATVGTADFSAPLIGLLIATFMSGVVAIQAFIYYREYPKDNFYLKSLVAVVCVLDLAHLISIIQFVYHYTVTHWGDRSVLGSLPWGWGMEIFFNALITAVCQGFLTYRLHTMSHGNWPVSVLASSLALVQLGCGLRTAMAGYLLRDNLLKMETFKTMCIVWLASAAVDDAIIAVALAYYIAKSRNSWNSGMTSRLIIFVIGTGALTSIVAAVDLVTFVVWPKAWLHLAFNFPLGRIYTNALLSSLNFRQSLRNVGKPSKMFFEFGNKRELESQIGTERVDIQPSSGTSVLLTAVASGDDIAMRNIKDIPEKAYGSRSDL